MQQPTDDSKADFPMLYNVTCMAWEVNRTVRVRLDVSDDRKSDLHATNDPFQYCPRTE